MGPDGFCAASWASGDVAAAEQGAWCLQSLLRGGGWGLALALPTGWICTSSAQNGLPVRAIGPATVLLGELYRRDAGEGPLAAPWREPPSTPDLLGTCRALGAEGWGRYVLLRLEGEDLSAFRDPSGALDLLVWRQDRMLFAASGCPAALDFLLPADLELDWAQVGLQLGEPIAVSGASALRGLHTVAAGELLTLARRQRAPSREQLWTPATFARAPAGPDDQLANSLAKTGDTCIATLTKDAAPFLLEVSGGLDSAIVAGVIASQTDRGGARPRPARTVNYVTEDLEGDERRYARSVAELWGLELNERAKPALHYTEEILASLGADVRLGLQGFDPDYDADLARQARDHGLTTIVTGQGGDAVFLQMVSPRILSDRLRAGEACRKPSCWRMRAGATARSGACSGRRSPEPFARAHLSPAHGRPISPRRRRSSAPCIPGCRTSGA